VPVETPDRLVIAMNTGSILAHSYDYPLVALSAIISILASYTALDLTERVRKAKGWLRPVWLSSGMMVMGLGIWAMHYVGMPYFPPSVPVRYDWPTALLALLAVSVASGVALFAAARPGANLWPVAAGSVSMGAGIAAMNYFGIEAMRFAGFAVFSPWTVLLSVALASGISFLALLPASARGLAETPWAGRRLAAALCLGLAAPIAQYAWMFGTTFYAAPQLVPDLAHAVPISRFALTTVALVSLIILAHVCAISRIDRRTMLNEHQFLQSQMQLRTVFDNLAEGIAVLDLEGNILVANETTARVAGCKNADSMHGKLVEFTDAFTLAGAPVPLDERPILLAMKGQYVHGCEVRLRAKGAPAMSFIEISTAPIPGPDGNPAQIIVTYRDITERKRADEAKGRLAAIVESSEDAIIGLDDHALVTSWNRGAEKLFGYATGEIVGTSITRLIPEEREGEEDRILESIRRGDTVDHFETVRQRKDGRGIDVSLTISPVRDSTGAVVGASKIARNITEGKRQKDALHESQQRLTGIIDSAMDAIITVDEQRRIVLFNTAAERMFGCSQSDAMGGLIDRFIPHRFHAAHSGHIRRFSETGMTGRAMGELGALWALRADGEEFQIEASISQIESRGHKLFTVILRDVTDRIRAEDSLREQAEELARSQQSLEEKTIMLQSVLDSMSEGLVAADEQGRFMIWNPAAEKIIGLGPSGVSAEDWNEHYGVFLPDTVTPLPSDRNPLSLAIAGESNSAVIFVRNRNIPAGAFLEISANPLRDKNGTPRGGVTAFRDVTERTMAEEKARQSEEKFAKAFRSSPIGMSITTMDEGRHVDVNQALSKMLGYVEHELVGHTEAELNIWMAPGQRTEVLNKLRQYGNVQSLETPFKAKSGETRTVNISMETIIVDGIECLLTTAIDVTETRNLEQQFRQSQKMEALGQLTGGIAHDFNNLLGVIVGNLDLLERQVTSDQVALKRVSAAKRASIRGAELTRRLLAFSRNEQLNPAPLAVGPAISELVELAARTLGPEIRISVQCDTDLPQILVDAAALESALLNLAVNARDAMPRGGSLILNAHLAEVSSNHALAQTGELAPGNYVRIAVSDTGHGMPRETLERAFEPFFTTKPRDKGTGLGLAMVYGFIKQSGGAIRLYSEPGFGTTVSLYLPLAGEAPAETEQAAPVKTAEKLGGTALLVDDEADLLDIADAFLAELGYTVIRAGDGASALAALEQAGVIDLMVTDIIMPGKMNGIELAQKVRALRPGIKVIYTSGFPAEALAERSGKLEGGPLLHKPYQRAEFADMVRKSVNASPQ
jgi:PAS domain S-box-containing protein